MDWELGPADQSVGHEVSPTLAYLYGVVIVLAVVIALGEWNHRRRRQRRTDDERRSAFRSYILMAALWPLFTATVIFIILWMLLTRRSR